MARQSLRLAAFSLVVSTLLIGGCSGDEDVESRSTIQGDVDSTAGRVERDSAAIADAPVFSVEPVAPIFDNPETVPTGNESVGYCDVRDADNLCIDFTGSAWNDGSAHTECSNAPGGSFRAETCPTGDRIGTCVIHPNGNASLEMVHSFYAPMDPILAEGICPGRFEAE